MTSARTGASCARNAGVDAASRLQIPDLLIIFSKAHHLFILSLSVLGQAREGLQLPPLMFGIGNALVGRRRTTRNAIHDVLDLRRPQKELVLVLRLASYEMLAVLLI